MKITKKIRRAAIELLSACACETATQDKLAWLHTTSEIMFDREDLDIYERDLVMQVAAGTWRDCLGTDDDAYPQNYVERYIEAEYRLRDGFTPVLED